MDRRSFIKLTAVTGTSATLASCGNPEHQLIRFVPDDELVPGIAEWKPSICPLCRAGCGLSVRVMEADVEVIRNGTPGMMRMGVAKKLEGNAAHPISHGGTCARGQAAIQVTFHPDRLRQPLKRTGSRGDGHFREVTWDEALTELAGQLDKLQEVNQAKALAVLTRPEQSVRQSLVRQFLARFGGQPLVTFEVFGDEVLRRANDMSFGREQLPTFDLARSGFVLSFGADFLGTWNSPVSHGFSYGAMRQGRPGGRGKFVQVESRMTQTGANADEWVPVTPGTDGVLALGLAHSIMKQGLRPASAGGRAGGLIAGWSAGLPDYAPDAVTTQTGVPVRRIERVARALVEHGPAVAIIGGSPLAHTNGLFSAVAVNALNALLGTVGEPGGLFFTPQIGLGAGQPAATRSGDPPAASSSTLEKLAADVLTAALPPVQVLLIDGANPVFGAPPAWRIAEALEKIPFLASFGSFVDETSALADLILPDHSFLESWVDSMPESGALVGVASVAPPAMRPLHQTRAMPDVLLDLGRRIKRPLDLPWQTFEEALHAAFGSLPADEGGNDVWMTAQKQGGWWGELPKGRPVAPAADDRRPSRTFTMEAAQFDGDQREYPFHFLPYASAAFLDGSLAHLPWLQEMPDPVTSAMWSAWVEINPKTAERLGIRVGDLVQVTSRQGSIHAPAVISPGIAPDIVAMPVGQGHRKFTRYASDRGENPITLLAAMKEPDTGALAWAATRVRIARAADADGRLILFAGEMREHPHEGETR